MYGMCIRDIIRMQVKCKLFQLFKIDSLISNLWVPGMISNIAVGLQIL